MHWRKEERKLVQARQNRCENEKAAGVTLKSNEFKHLGSAIQSNGQCTKEVKGRVQAG